MKIKSIYANLPLIMILTQISMAIPGKLCMLMKLQLQIYIFPITDGS